MGMSTHVVGFRPPDEQWKKMKAVWDACEEAGAAVPEKVDMFFNGVPPDEKGIEVNLDPPGECTERWGDESRSGFEVDLSKLPSSITHIRFYNSW